jgi:hypothetical protein
MNSPEAVMVGVRSAAFSPQRCCSRRVVAGFPRDPSLSLMNSGRLLMPSKYLGALAPLASLWAVRPSYARRRKIAPFP